MNTPSIITNKKLCVFDFDFTLVASEKQYITVYHENGGQTVLDSFNWSEYQQKPGDKFDFSEFDYLNKPEKIEQPWKTFLDRMWSNGYDHTYILTARGSTVPLEKYFDDHGIRVQCVGIGIPPGANNGHYKAKWIEDKIQEGFYGTVEFFDDRDDCVTHVGELGQKYPHVKFHVWQVTNGEMNKCF